MVVIGSIALHHGILPHLVSHALSHSYYMYSMYVHCIYTAYIEDHNVLYAYAGVKRDWSNGGLRPDWTT